MHVATFQLTMKQARRYDQFISYLEFAMICYGNKYRKLKLQMCPDFHVFFNLGLFQVAEVSSVSMEIENYFSRQSIG